MNVTKITWLILFFSVLVIAVLGGSFYLYSLQKQETLSARQQGEKEFFEFFAQKKKLPQADEEVSLVAVGDISYSRAVERIVRKQNNINYPFLKIRDYLKKADLVFGNLETPITQGLEIPDFEMVFRSNPGTEKALEQAGFSILSLANNHTPNFGEKGLEDTFNFLKNAGIKYVGAGQNEQEAYQVVFIEKKGIQFAFLAYNDADVVPSSYEALADRAGTAFMRIDKMAEAVKEAKQKSDFVIISMHSGTEYADKPNDSQVDFAHASIDAGADLVIGHHPHVVQTIEKYKGKFILYSLGNFVFDQPQMPETKEGLTIKIHFIKGGISKIFFFPVVMEKLAQPRPANREEANKILKRLDFSTMEQAVYLWSHENRDFKQEARWAIYEDNLTEDRGFSKREEADLDSDTMFESYVLENGKLIIAENEKTIWQSPDDWQIDDFFLADANNDGIIDINLSLWKSGNFGSSKPFWVKENDMSVKNHFFILDFSDDAIKQIWCSSNLTAPNYEFAFADIDDDGKSDLIVIEGDYSQLPSRRGNYLAVWKWNGWGFSNEWRSEQGNFFDLEIERDNERNYIVVSVD